jgi:hypothetical protein
VGSDADQPKSSEDDYRRLAMRLDGLVAKWKSVFAATNTHLLPAQAYDTIMGDRLVFWRKRNWNPMRNNE